MRDELLFLDTNVLVYFFDVKNRGASQLRRCGALGLWWVGRCSWRRMRRRAMDCLIKRRRAMGPFMSCSLVIPQAIGVGLKDLICGSPGRARTADLVVNSHPLYQLSYRGIKGADTT